MTALAVSTAGYLIGGTVLWLLLLTVGWGMCIDSARRERASRQAFARMKAERTNAIPQQERTAADDHSR